MTTTTTETPNAATADSVASLPQTIEEAQQYLANPSTRQILDFYATSPYLRDAAFAYHSLEDTSFGTTEEELLNSLPLLPLDELFSIHDLLNVQASVPVVVQWDDSSPEANGEDAGDEDEDHWVTEQNIKAIGKLFNPSRVGESLWAQAVLGLPKSVVAELWAKTKRREHKKKHKRQRRKSKNLQEQARQEPEVPEKPAGQQDSRAEKKARRKREKEAARQLVVKQEGAAVNETAEEDQKKQADGTVEAKPALDEQNDTTGKRKRSNRKKARTGQKKLKVNGEAHVEESPKEVVEAKNVNANVDTMSEKQAEPSRIEHGTALELDYIEQQAVIPLLELEVTARSNGNTSDSTQTFQDKLSSVIGPEDVKENHITITENSGLNTGSEPLLPAAQIATVPSPSSIVFIPPDDICAEVHLAPRRTTRTTTSPSKSPYFAPSKASTPRQKLSPTKSPNFSPAISKPASSPRVPAGTSCLPFPPLSSRTFGLIQETLAHTPFHLLLAVSLLNKTRGSVAIPIIHTLIAQFPTPESMAAANVEDIVPLIHHLGLQNNRAKTMVAMARMWVAQEPCRGKRYRTLNYPWKGAGKGIGRHEVLPDEYDSSGENGDEEELKGAGPVADAKDVLGEDAIAEEVIAGNAAPNDAVNGEPMASNPETGNVIDLEDYDDTTSHDSHTDNESTQNPTPPPIPKPPSTTKAKPKSKAPAKSKKSTINTNLSPSSKRHTSGAWEIAHLPGVGAYAIDSWRIFCRDVLRGVTTGWDGEDARALAALRTGSSGKNCRSANANGHDADPDVDADARDDEMRTGQSSPNRHSELKSEGQNLCKFEPEWMRVLPLDKELRAYLRWKWLKKGWVWDQLTGTKRRAEDVEVEKVMEEEGAGTGVKVIKGEVAEMDDVGMEAVEAEE